MSICIHNESTIPEKSTFCHLCAEQVRCKECREFLLPNAVACSNCGIKVGEGTATSTIAQNNSNREAFNTLELKETRNSRNLKVTFVTEAIKVIGDAVSEILVDRLGNPDVPKRDNGRLQITGETVPEDKDYIDVEAAVVPPNGDSNLSPEAKSDRDKLHEVFYYNGETLKLDNYSLKAAAQLDAARRLVYLFIYAHELEGRTTVARDAINAVLKDIDLFEPNISNWISNTPDLAQEGDESAPAFRLRKNGRDAAKAVLSDIFNPEKKDEWSLTNKPKPRKKSKSSENDSEGSSASGRKSASGKPGEVDSWVNKWTNLKLDVDAYSVIKATSAENKGIIALWAIRKATNNEIKVVNGNRIRSFLSKAFHAGADRANLVRSLEEKAQGKVRRGTSGYELTDEGLKHAEELLNYKSETAKEKKSSKTK